MAESVCRPGDWIVPETGASASFAELLATVEPGGILLLGEHHDNPRHHRWQASVLSGLIALGKPLSLGFESFPRRLQPALDSWVAGELDEPAFRREVDWDSVWGFSWDGYHQLFELARLYRIPMIALNVERSLVRRVGREGWDNIETEAREGLSDPADAPSAYRKMLEELLGGSHHGDEEKSEVDPQRLKRFVEAQLTWDRAMAEALALYQHPSRIVVGIAGSGHLRFRHGIAHQLHALGLASRTWLPVVPEDCGRLDSGLAEAVFVIDDPPPVPAPPRLGAGLEVGEEGLKVSEVIEGSVAQAAGLREGDVIRTAAGSPVTAASELVAIVQAQPPGSWLPIIAERSGAIVPLIAQFPVAQKEKRSSE